MQERTQRHLTRASVLVAAALLAPPSVAAGDLAEQIDSRMQRLFPAEEPGAVVLIAREDEVLVRGAWGLADIEHGVPMTADAVFHLASVSKLFTATAVLQLVQSGELKLDGGPAEVFPAQRDAGITLRHLLSHTSGIPEYLDRPDALAWIRTELALDELIESFAGRPLDFPPGTRAAYSNSNYVLLAARVERARAKSFAYVLEEQVFEPAGMTDTRCGGRSEIVPRRALGYELAPGGFRNEKFYSMSILTGASGVLSTADDLLRFLRTLFAGKLVQPEWLALSADPMRLTSGETTRFGLGWELEQIHGQTALMKGGAISGFTHYVLALPTESLFVIVLTNRPPDETRRPWLLCLQFAELALE